MSSPKYIRFRDSDTGVEGYKWVWPGDPLYGSVDVLNPDRDSLVTPGLNFQALNYDRAWVSKPEVIEMIAEALGLTVDKISRMIVDAKVTPVVVVNDYNYSQWIYKWSFDVFAVTGLVAVSGVQLVNNGVSYINTVGSMVCLDKEGNLINSNMVSLSVADETRGSRIHPVVDSSGVNDVLIVYRDGMEIFSVDTLLGAGTIAVIAVSANGKYIMLLSSSVGVCEAYMYEGVV